MQPPHTPLTDADPRPRLDGPGAARTRRAVAWLGALLSTFACGGDDPPGPAPAIVQFDPIATPPQIPQPSFTTVDPLSGRLDLGRIGIDVPDDCTTLPELAVASCELDQYLESLDGFPTSTVARAGLSAEPDPAALAASGGVVVVEGGSKKRITEVDLAVDPARAGLQVTPLGGWPVGAFVWVGVRGFESGIRAGGRPVVASPFFDLLREHESLSCGAKAANEVPPGCRYIAILSRLAPGADAGPSLLALEGLRAGLAEHGAWDAMAEAGALARSELAVLWGFPIHSGSVVELDPGANEIPRVTGGNQIGLPVNGPIDPATVSLYDPRTRSGSVLFMDMSALSHGDIDLGFPKGTAAFVDGAIVITAEDPLVPGIPYGLALSNEIRNPAGTPLVSPPLAVLLKARGPLLDPNGSSTVAGLPDDQAAALEPMRVQVASMLDPGAALARGTDLGRDDLVYVYLSFLAGL